MKKLLVVLPLLLTACSSVQLKHEPIQKDTVIHIQPYTNETEVHIPAIICRTDKETPVVTDWLRPSDLNHDVTISYLHNGYVFQAEGKLVEFNADKVKLEEVVNLYFTALHTFYTVPVTEYVNVSEIEFVLVEGNGEAY